MYGLKLIPAENITEPQFMDYYNEWTSNNEQIIPMAVDFKGRTFSEWLKITIDFKDEATCPENLVPADTYFLVDKEWRILGAVNIRKRLNEYLAKFGGNIGYGVRKSERRKGYGKLMLRLALGIWFEGRSDEVLISCNKNNLASKNTILSCGGKLLKEISDGDVKKIIYKIDKEVFIQLEGKG
jgi:predicted acetyltransferase